MFAQSDFQSDYGHLLHNDTVAITTNQEEDVDSGVFSFQDNYAVMNQEDAIVFDDPMLSSTYEERLLPTNENNSAPLCQNQLQCKWEDCYQIYDTQTSLVRHIEKSHVELKRGKQTPPQKTTTKLNFHFHHHRRRIHLFLVGLSKKK